MKNNYFLIAFFFTACQAFAQVPACEWVKNIAGGFDDSIKSIQTDQQGNVYAVGQFNSNAISCNGTLVYNTTTGSAAWSAFNDAFFIKYDPNGNIIWIKKIVGIYHENIRAIDIDAAGNCYILGDYTSPSITLGAYNLVNPIATSSNIFGQDAYMTFLAKYDVDGNVVWAKQFGSTTHNLASSLDVDAAGNIVFSGGYGGPTITLGSDTFTNVNPLNSYYQEIYISKLDTNGDFIWSKSAGGYANDWARVKFDHEGNVVMSANFMSQTFTFDGVTINNQSALQSASNSYVYGTDFMIVKYDASGNMLWYKNGGGLNFDSIASFDFDAQNNIVLTGYFLSSSIAYDSTTLNLSGGALYLTKLDPSGGVIWCKNKGNISTLKPEIVKIDGNGNIYVLGSFAGNANFDGVTASYNVLYTLANFVAKFNADGVCQFIKTSDGQSGQSMENYDRIAFSSQGDLYFAGDSRGFVTHIDSYTFTDSSNSLNTFIAKINHNNLASANFDLKQDLFSVYPNPAKDVLNIQGITGDNGFYIITDITGKIVKSKPLSDLQVQVGDLGKGVYFFGYKNQSVRFIKE
jgi:hypothetical protein